MHRYSSFTWLDRSLDVRELQFHRLAHRQLMVHLFSKSLAKIVGSLPRAIADKGSVCLVGSLARGEFDIENSDVDLWFLGFEPSERNHILRAISQEFRAADIGLSENDLLLILKDEGKAQQKDWNKYPCLDDVDFIDCGFRRAQLLFETVPAYNHERYQSLQKLALQAAGIELRGRHVRQNPAQIYKDIGAYAATVNTSEFSSGVDFAKQLVSRRLGQHLMRLSVLEAVYRKRTVSDSPDPDGKYIEILQTPTASKALFWASTDFLHGKMMSQVAEQEFAKLHRDLRRFVRGSGFEFATPGDPRQLFGRLAILATRDYSTLLNLLHSKSLRTALLEVDDFTLSYRPSNPNLDQLVSSARRFVHTCSTLVKALEMVFLQYDAARLFTRPYCNGGLELAVYETLQGLTNDPLSSNT